MAAPKQKKRTTTRKRRERKNVERGQVHIHSSVCRADRSGNGRKGCKRAWPSYRGSVCKGTGFQPRSCDSFASGSWPGGYPNQGHDTHSAQWMPSAETPPRLR